MGHFGVPEPPRAGEPRASLEGASLEDGEAPDSSFMPLARSGSAPPPMQDSMDESGTTSFVMRTSPFMPGQTPGRHSSSAGALQGHNVSYERAQDRSNERVDGDTQQWLPTCDEVPEENWELSAPLRQGRCDCLVDEGVAPLQSSLKPRHVADDTDAEFNEPLVQPLRPRTRALPGNTAVGDSAGGRCIQEKKPRLLQEKQPVIVAAPAPVEAGRLASPLLDENLTVSEAAAAVSLRDLAELRSFRNPPAVVCQVLEAVAVLLGMSDVRWAKMRKLLDKDFISRVRAFDPVSTTPAQAERFALLLQVPTFSDGLLGERCPAVLSLAAWCNSVGRQLEAPLPQAPPPPMPLPTTGRSSRREMLHTSEAELATGLRSARPELDGLKVEPDLWSLDKDELAQVSELTISRDGIGAVTFHGLTDCRSLVSGRRLSDIIVLNPGEVVVYPNQSMKPPVGVGLNKPASVVLYGCLPKAQGFRDRRARERYRKRVKQMTEDKGAEFVDYDCDEGIWQFKVVHF